MINDKSILWLKPDWLSFDDLFLIRFKPMWFFKYSISLILNIVGEALQKCIATETTFVKSVVPNDYLGNLDKKTDINIMPTQLVEFPWIKWILKKYLDADIQMIKSLKNLYK